MEKLGKKLENILFIESINLPAEDIVLEYLTEAIIEATGRKEIKVYDSCEEAERKENLSQVDLLIIDASDDNNKRTFKSRLEGDYFTERFREINPLGWVIGLSVQPAFLTDGIAKKVYDDTIMFFGLKKKEIIERMKKSIEYAGLRAK